MPDARTCQLLQPRALAPCGRPARMHTVVLDDQHRTPEAAAFVCQPCGMHLARWGATATLHTITDQCHAGTCRARQHLPELERDAG